MLELHLEASILIVFAGARRSLDKGFLDIL